MTPQPIVEPAHSRPADHRPVPLLTEPAIGHYPEFRRFLADAFGLAGDRIGPPGLLRVEDRHYELAFLGRSGEPYPSGVEVRALVPGLEPLDEAAADRDVWAILRWLVDGVGGDWTSDALATTARIYRLPAAASESPEPAAAEPPPPEPAPRPVVAFDIYGTLVDPLALAADLALYLPEDDAGRVAATWRRTQIDYAFRATVMHRYEDFASLTERALDFALLEAGRSLDPDARAAVLARYDALEPFPDVRPALEALHAAGADAVVLSNGTPAMLEACLTHAGLRPFFSRVLSVDEVRAFKPHPAVYRLAARATRRPLGEIHLVSCNPFDVVGAATAGMPTVWVNRDGRPFDTLGPHPDRTITTLAELPALLPRRR